MPNETPAAEPSEIPQEEMRKLSGLEMLRGIMEGRYPPPPIGLLMDFSLIEAEHGHAVFSGNPQRRFYNPIGTVHGGYAATLLDSCMGCAVHSALKAGQAYTTVEFKINLVRPMTENTGTVRAEGKTINVGRQIATAEGFLYDLAGKVLAHGTTTCIILAHRAH